MIRLSEFSQPIRSRIRTNRHLKTKTNDRNDFWANVGNATLLHCSIVTCATCEGEVQRGVKVLAFRYWPSCLA